MYPEMKQKYPETVTQNSFKGEFVKRPDAIRLAEANIKMEGETLHKTSNFCKKSYILLSITSK